MSIFQMLVQTGHTLAGVAPFFRIGFPLIFGVAVGLMGVYGVMGLTKGRTLFLLNGGRRAGRAFWVEGIPARILGAFYLVVMLPFFGFFGSALTLGLTGLM